MVHSVTKYTDYHANVHYLGACACPIVMRLFRSQILLTSIAYSLIYYIIISSLRYTVSQKTVQICFCQNLGKFPPILIIFDR